MKRCRLRVIREGNLPVLNVGLRRRPTLEKAVPTPSGHIERHPGPKRALLVRTRNKPPPASQRYDVAVSQFEDYLRLKKHSRGRKLVSHGTHEMEIADLCAVRRSVTSLPPLAVQYSFSNVIITHQLQVHPWIVRPVWWLNGSPCMNGSPFIASQTHFTPAEGELEREVWDSFKADSWRMKTILLQVTKKRVRLLG